MQSTVQNLREGLWNLPSTVNSLLLAGTLLDSGRGSSSEELTRDQKTRSPAERDDNNNDDAEEEPPDSDQEDDELAEKRTHASDRMSAEPMSSSVGSLRALCDEPEQDERGEKDPTATTTATNTAGPDPAVLRVKWQLVQRKDCRKKRTICRMVMFMMHSKSNHAVLFSPLCKQNHATMAVTRGREGGNDDVIK